MKQFSPLTRVLVLGILIILLQFPIGKIYWMLHDRVSTKLGAQEEISQLSGQAQTITGPVLTVPYLKRYKNSKGEERTSKHRLFLFPEELKIEGDARSEIRNRGIFEVPVYSSTLTISGAFKPAHAQNDGIKEENLLWEEARLFLGMSDTRAIRKSIDLLWQDQTREFETEFRPNCISETGVSLNPQFPEGALAERYSFAFQLEFGGTAALSFVPIGKQTSVALQSEWNNPSFMGAFLPTHRTVDENGFSAEWSIPDLGRGFGQVLHCGDVHRNTGYTSSDALRNAEFGVEFLSPVDGYRMTERAMKYELLFFFLTFLAFYLFEVFFKLRIHPIQYLLVGSALALFYLLLLSLSEHVGFGLAYLAASLVVSLMVTNYTHRALKNSQVSLSICGIVSSLYGFLYVLLAAQDYSLLLGTSGLTLILALVMFVTSDVDWYALTEGKTEAKEGTKTE